MGYNSFMKNGKSNHSKNGNNSVPISIAKSWFDKTEKILWTIEKNQEEDKAWHKKMIEKQDKRIEASEKRIEQNEQVLAELKESNKEQKNLNAIFSREILKSHGYTNEQIDRMLSSKK